MAGFAPPAEIDGAPRLPLPYGLFSVVSIAESSTERWENGVVWQALTCAPAGIVVGDCNAPEGFPKQFVSGDLDGVATAFTVYGTYKCSSFGNPISYAQQRAREHLEAAEQWAVERRLWGVLDNNPTILTGPNPGVSLGLLEDFIADNYGSLGVIHASRNAATTLAGKQLIEVRNGRMETKIGTPVVVGGGYPGTGAAQTETQTLTKTGTPTAGNITLTYDGQTTGNIPWNATSAQVKTALDALSNIDTVTTAGGPLNTTAITITFTSDPGENVPQMTVNGAFTGGGAAVTTTTLGDVGTPPGAGTEYIAASPALFGYRSQIFEATNREGDLLDTKQNNLFGIAERNYLLGYDPCGVAFSAITLGV